MADRIAWVHRSQRPCDLGRAVALSALLASPDVELSAVAPPERDPRKRRARRSARSSRSPIFREMVVSKEIDAVAVVVRVPAH